jgi:hypothetical protein
MPSRFECKHFLECIKKESLKQNAIVLNHAQKGGLHTLILECMCKKSMGVWECVSVDLRVGEYVCQIRVKVTLNAEYKWYILTSQWSKKAATTMILV